MPFDLEFVRQHWSGPVLYFETIGSTMDEAVRLAESGCPNGAMVLANEQTAGQGRHGRGWHSERNAGLYVSIVLRPNLPPETMPVLTLALGLATAVAIGECAGLDCDLRWPNDVMLGDRKTAGILVQLAGTAAVAGIGVNVNHSVFPADIAGEATSLRIVSNRLHSREHLLIALLAAVEHHVRNLEMEDGRGSILRTFSQRSSYARNKRVKVGQGASMFEGTTAGLDPSGFLIIRKDNGAEELVLAGGVRPVT